MAVRSHGLGNQRHANKYEIDVGQVGINLHPFPCPPHVHLYGLLRSSFIGAQNSTEKAGSELLFYSNENGDHKLRAPSGRGIQTEINHAC